MYRYDGHEQCRALRTTLAKILPAIYDLEAINNADGSVNFRYELDSF